MHKAAMACASQMVPHEASTWVEFRILYDLVSNVQVQACSHVLKIQLVQVPKALRPKYSTLNLRMAYAQVILRHRDTESQRITFLAESRSIRPSEFASFSGLL